MIDHLLCFPDEKTAHAALDPIGLGFPADKETDAHWDTSRIVAPVQVTSDGAALTGYWMLVGLDDTRPVDMAFSAALQKLKNNTRNAPKDVKEDSCLLRMDREAGRTASRQEDYATLAASADADVFAKLRIEPMLAGSEYPTGEK